MRLANVNPAFGIAPARQGLTGVALTLSARGMVELSANIKTECFTCIKATELGEHKADINNLKEWQRTQNGALVRMAEDIKALNNRLNSLQWWLIGLMGTSLASLVLLLFNLVKGGGR